MGLLTNYFNGKKEKGYGQTKNKKEKGYGQTKNKYEILDLDKMYAKMYLGDFKQGDQIVVDNFLYIFTEAYVSSVTNGTESFLYRKTIGDYDSASYDGTNYEISYKITDSRCGSVTASQD